jgi:hypothetical protein
MMGGRTAWNVQSIYINKYHCVTLHLVGLIEYININDARSHERKISYISTSESEEECFWEASLQNYAINHSHCPINIMSLH